MAVTVPLEVALMLNFLGVPFAEVLAIDEDQVAELAQAVRDFATRVQDTHEAASAEIAALGSTSSGHSYQALVASWARMSTTNMAQLDQASAVVADVLDAAAVTISVAKAAVVANLAVLAAAFAGTMAATIATSGLSAALIPALRIAAQRLLTALEQMLLFYIATEVITKAIEPFEAAVDEFVNGWAYDTTADLLGVDTGVDTNEFRMDPHEWERTANALGGHADDMQDHGTKFADKLAGLTFVTPDANLDNTGLVDDRPLGRLPDPDVAPPRGADDPLGWVGAERPDHPGLDTDNLVSAGAGRGPTAEPSVPSGSPNPESPIAASTGTNGYGGAPVTHQPGVPGVPDAGITDRPEISGRSDTSVPRTGVGPESGQLSGKPSAGPQTPWTDGGPVAGQNLTQHLNPVPPPRIDAGPPTYSTSPVGRNDQHAPPPWSPSRNATGRAAQPVNTRKPRRAEPTAVRPDAAQSAASTPWSTVARRKIDQPKEVPTAKVVAPNADRRHRKGITTGRASPARQVDKPPELPESQEKAQGGRSS